jgi:hypothetical protein
MSFTHGMNVEQVRQLGHLLQAKADEIITMLGQIDSQLNSTTWEGPDAQQFKGQWWPEHKGRLQQVSEGIRGFGQSALNNASAQEDASSH